ncbi:MAG TPA: M1 family metallopeptidase [Fimbriiglobus sp.]
MASSTFAADPAPEKDLHSFSNPEHLRVKSLFLQLDVNFETRVLTGDAMLTIERVSADKTQPLVLDTRGLKVLSVTEIAGDDSVDAKFVLGKVDPILGQSLTIPIRANTTMVIVNYKTSPNASALQWLSPAQTAGKKKPYLFTQSEAIDARSWVPCQDTPAVRFTYKAAVKTPPGLLAVMSAGNDPEQKRTGEYSFEMNQPIPSYLLALAVGDIAFRKVGPRTGVYAEPSVVDKAAREFSDLEAMVKACEKLYGPYQWGRYDVLVMPPSFPFGGMENPRLTFFSPTIIAGDKSLVSVAAHELAHSWSGNLVTNATWRDFWLNEGFTVYIERRIMEEVYGKARADEEAVLGKQTLVKELAELPKSDQILHIDLKGRSPDSGLSDVPYEKGALFLKHLEGVYGREAFDKFLKSYFAHFAFHSITTATFAKYLDENLLRQGDPTQRAKANVDEWLYQPGIPAGAPNPTAPTFAAIEAQARDFLAGKTEAANLPAKKWSTQEWLHFFDSVPAKIGTDRMKDLDAAFSLTTSGNSEVLFQWLLLAVKNDYAPAYPRLESFLTEQGRRKFLQPLYEELVKTGDGKARAVAIYKKARPTYHPSATLSIDAIVGGKEK